MGQVLHFLNCSSKDHAPRKWSPSQDLVPAISTPKKNTYIHCQWKEYIYIYIYQIIPFHPIYYLQTAIFFKYPYTGDIEGCCHLLEVGVFVDRLVPARFLSLRGTKETDIRNSNVSWRYCPERPIRRGYSKSYVMFVDVVRFQERGVRRGK